MKASARVVIADESGIIREGLAALLGQDPDLEVVGQVGDGLECVKLVGRQHPDVVLLDVSMPGLNGIDTARRILATVPGARILFLSSRRDHGFVKSAFEAGGCGYLLKQCTFSELILALRVVLAGQIYLSPSVAHVVVEEYCAMRSAQGGAKPIGSCLTAREREIMQLLAEGHTTHDIAQRLHISQKTVGTHREHIMMKLKLGNIVELTRCAIREGITSLEIG